MSKIIRLTSNNLFNNINSINSYIYPKIFFDKVYTSNNIRNNTIKYNFNYFDEQIYKINTNIININDNIIYFQKNKIELQKIIEQETVALNQINKDIQSINNMIDINFNYVNVFSYFHNNIKPTLNDFKQIKIGLTISKFDQSNLYTDNMFYKNIIKFLITKNFIIEYNTDYYKIPIVPFIIKYDNYFLNLIFSANKANYIYISNMDDLYSYDPSIEESLDNKYQNVEYAIINKQTLTTNDFIRNLGNFILIGDNIPI